MESVLLNGKMAHGAHPVLTMCAANAVVQTDPAGGRKLSKSRSRGRIDGMSALMDMFAAAPDDADDKAGSHLPDDFRLKGKSMNRAYSLLTVKAVDEDQRIITGVATTPRA
jgi:phage terminase large subunit-like protein